MWDCSRRTVPHAVVHVSLSLQQKVSLLSSCLWSHLIVFAKIAFPSIKSLLLPGAGLVNCSFKTHCFERAPWLSSWGFQDAFKALVLFDVCATRFTLFPLSRHWKKKALRSPAWLSRAAHTKKPHRFMNVLG